MTEVKPNIFLTVVEQHKSDATAQKVDEINECLRLRKIAMGLGAYLKAPVPIL